MLIGSNGEKLGLLSIEDALSNAKAASMDLVQVSRDDSEIVVCKLLDYGKYLFDKKKNKSNSKVKLKRNTVKEIKFRPSTDVADFNIKLKRLKALFLTEIRLK